MDRTVADLNIAHFKKLLAAETDPVKRQTIEHLLAEEEAKLVVRCQHSPPFSAGTFANVGIKGPLAK